MIRKNQVVQKMNNYSNNDIFNRTIRLIGEDSFNKINKSNILVFGLGGVGSYVVEALVRSGLGKISIVDKDVVDVSNINRQLIANIDNIGKAKTIVMKERILSINPNCEVECYNMLFLPNNSSLIDFSRYDYVIDCIDNVSAKIEIIRLSKESNVKVISSMGTGNKLDPTKFEIKDINQTSVCPLAKTMRYELKKRNIKDVKVLFSTEIPVKNNLFDENNKPVPASIAFVPSVAGLMIASYVINDLIK